MEQQGNKHDPKEATDITIVANKDVLHELDFSDKQDFEDATRGMMETFPDLDIINAEGKSIFNLKSYNFLTKKEAPPTVNPSLWRQARLNLINGLFKVTDGIYQIREFDISNMTIIEGQTGLIVIDPLGSEECAKFGLEVYFKHRPKREIVAVMYTHSHLDHYGGVKGVITEEDARSEKVKVIAPKGFFEAAISENVYAGFCMGRRAYYHMGASLPKNVTGQVDSGIGKAAAHGTHSIIEPNVTISETCRKLCIDGVEILFLLAENTEAPAEMLMYFPQFKAICTAEDCSRTMHNLYTLRGAEVRDAKAWWKTLNSVIDMWTADADVMFAQHHWPIWDNKRVVEALRLQRDMYKYLHDHTLNLINQGYTMLEVGEMVKLPEALSKKFYNRGYYGTSSHNAKAVYQKYIGFYSGNPADLHQLPPEDAAKKFVEYMGGADAILQKATKDFSNGEYRWVAQVMNHVVFADPTNQKARELEADALEQLGYQTESGIWRNNYLSGASELRNGLPPVTITGVATPETIRSMTLEMIFDFMGIRLNVHKAAGKKIVFNFDVLDSKEKYVLSLENSVLVYSKDRHDEKADATVSMKTREPFNDVIAGLATFEEKIKAGAIEVSGSESKVAELFGMQDTFSNMFCIVTP